MRTPFSAIALILALSASFTASAQTGFSFTRGIGQYPGRQSEFFGPRFEKAEAGNAPLVNLALHRQALASSSVDYNLCAHLATDGIIDSCEPAILVASTPEGRLPKREAEWAIDGGPFSNQVLLGEHTWLRYDWGGDQRLAARALRLDGRVAYREDKATEGYTIAVQASDDGVSWTTVGQLKGRGLPGNAMDYKVSSDPNKQTATDYLPARTLEQTIRFDRSVVFQHLRLVVDMPGAAYWVVNDLHFLDDVGQEVWAQPSQEFASMWMSDGGGLQWLRIDLGAPSTVEKVVPYWHEEPRRWHYDVATDGSSVTIVMEEPSEAGFYALREVEVWGRQSQRLVPQPVKGWEGNRYELSGGHWKLKRSSEVKASGAEIATDGFDDASWLWATVPGTVLMSYVNAGAVPNPNYADWVDQISESFFRSNFWYRDVFEWKPEDNGERAFLNFDGINWKARVWLNGSFLGTVEGAFRRGRFDVTGLLREGDNVLAVEVVCNEHFGVVKEKDANTTQFNGGILGADNPTFHATIGWDWITTVRGRNVGIWNEVYLTREGALTLSDPYVKTRVGQKVEVTPSVFVRNNSAQPVLARLCGWIGDVEFERDIQLPALSEQEFTFSPEDYPQLADVRLPLWWPNGYGEPALHEAGFSLKPATRLSMLEKESSILNFKFSILNYKAGLREMTYEGLGDSLLIYVNGRRFVPLGGNWGMDEHNLCYRRREYDAAVSFHRYMHATMIRNWVGMTGDDDFYRACDSLGVMVWQDFWLANPCDGPDPYDETLFLGNAYDYVRRIRSHASLGIFCGRNEGYPPATIDRSLRHFVATLTPGMGYIPSSADDCVTGHGPYCAQPARVYFERQSGKIHTERGLPNVMNYENLARTLSPEALWPQSKQWGQHDYTLNGAQRASEFNGLVGRAFGPSRSAKEFTARAQVVNYNGYRSMFEATSVSRAGLLIWMSHPCWPSMVWQTYDYYFEPTAAFFGMKKGCEPLHIQLNALTDRVEVVNAFAGDRAKLTATATVYDLRGRRLWSQSQRLTAGDDTTVPLFALSAKARQTDCALLRLELREGKHLVSENDYYVGNDADSLSLAPLLNLPKANVETKTTLDLGGDLCSATVTLTNRGKALAPFIRLNLLGADGEQILPADYTDNYFNLLPAESRTVIITWRREDGRDGQPIVSVTALNE
ncbi:MAG: beta-glycosidase [Bacteroidaceae bacterium]|nr:beta-glycosidase [Bacteroidaceae bacterium]